MPNKTIEDFAYQIKDYMRSAEVVPSKNQLKNNLETSTFSGVTATHNADDSITLTNTATNNQWFGISAAGTINEFNVKLNANVTYVLSAGSNMPSGIALYGRDASENYLFRVESGASYAQYTPSNDIYINIACRVSNGTATGGFTIYPMLCTLEEWEKSHTYEPYYVPVKDSKMSWEDQGMLGAINYLQRSYNGGSTQGVTYAINADEELTATWSSTPTGSAIITYMSARTLNLKAGKRYKVTGCPSGGGWSTNNLKYRIYLYDSLTGLTVAVDTGDGAEFMATNTEYAFFVVIGTDAGASGSLTFKPMISLADANLSYDDFQPYAMTNRELTEKVTPKTSSITYETGISQYVATNIPLNKVLTMGSIAIDVTGVVGNASTWIIIGTVPIGFRPRQNASLIAGAYGKNDKFDCVISTNGDLKIRDNTAAVVAGDIIYINGIYILA